MSALEMAERRAADAQSTIEEGERIMREALQTYARAPPVQRPLIEFNIRRHGFIVAAQRDKFRAATRHVDELRRAEESRAAAALVAMDADQEGCSLLNDGRAEGQPWVQTQLHLIHLDLARQGSFRYRVRPCMPSSRVSVWKTASSLGP